MSARLGQKSVEITDPNDEWAAVEVYVGELAYIAQGEDALICFPREMIPAVVAALQRDYLLLRPSAFNDLPSGCKPAGRL